MKNATPTNQLATTLIYLQSHTGLPGHQTLLFNYDPGKSKNYPILFLESDGLLREREDEG